MNRLLAAAVAALVPIAAFAQLPKHPAPQPSASLGGPIVQFAELRSGSLPVLAPGEVLFVADPQPGTTTPPATKAGTPTAPPAITGAATPFAEGVFVEGPCCGSAHPETCWVSAEYLCWRVSGGRLPPLITTSPAGTPVAQAGLLATPGSSVLFGGGDYLNDWRSGFRISAGAWLTNDKTIGVEGSFFMLASKSVGASAAGGDNGPIVASSPFIDAVTGAPSRVLVAYPGIASGSTSVDYSGKRIYGLSLFARGQLCCGDDWRVDGLVGYQCISLDESLTIRKTILPNPNGPIAAVPGTVIFCDDGWNIENQAHGLALGFNCEKCCGDWSFVARPTLLIGQVSSTVNRGGQTTITVPGQTTAVYPGGTYNLSSNLGETTYRDWTVIPELDLKAAYRVSDSCRVFAGYTFLYLPQVARAGDQIDPRVNQALIPPATLGASPALPAAFVERSAVWLHGLSVGVEFRY